MTAIDLANRLSTDPWRELDRLERRMNQLFFGTPFIGRAGLEPRVSAGFPAVNVYSGEEGAIVTAELPGLQAKDIDISIRGELLTLRGTFPERQEEKGQTYLCRERSAGKFNRNVELPFAVDADKAVATFKRGVLNLHLPRAATERSQRIKVKGA